MKSIFLILFATIFHYHSIAQSTIQNAIEVNISLDKQYDKIFSKDEFDKNNIEYVDFIVNSDSVKVKYFDISIDVKNTSSKPIYIWLMSCSWQRNFVINNNYMKFVGWACDKNVPDRLEIKAGQKLSYKISLTQSIKFNYPGRYSLYDLVKSTKLGLIVVDDIFRKDFDKSFKYHVSMRDKSEQTIIWSNPLELLKL